MAAPPVALAMLSRVPWNERVVDPEFPWTPMMGVAPMSREVWATCAQVVPFEDSQHRRSVRESS